MNALAPSNMLRLDKLAISLSGLCAVHCLATAVTIGLLSSAADLLGAPIIHEVGLMIAMVLGALALGGGALRHRRIVPLLVGMVGLGAMGGALMLPHGWSGETMCTLAGVALLAFAHYLNSRSFA